MGFRQIEERKEMGKNRQNRSLDRKSDVSRIQLVFRRFDLVKKSIKQYVFLNKAWKLKFTLDGCSELSFSFSEKLLGFQKKANGDLSI